MSDSHNRINILYKFISNLLNTIIDVDVLQILKEQSTSEFTPVIYSIMNVWQLGEQTILNEDIVYDYENKLTKVFKQIPNMETDIIDFFKILIINELDNLSIYMNLSEKLSYIVIFIYACFYNKNCANSLIMCVNNYIPNKNYLQSIYVDVSIVLGGDF